MVAWSPFEGWGYGSHPLEVETIVDSDGRVLTSQKSADGLTLFLNADGLVHRVGGPAIIKPTEEQWLLNGLIHRDQDLPAIVYNSGEKHWFQNGDRHRVDGPAIEHADGGTEWWEKNQRHRVGAPAVEDDDGSREWWIRGALHRENGPALEHKDWPQEYWVNGVNTRRTHWAQLATNENTPPEKLGRIVHYKDQIIAFLAAHNPNCPEWARVEWFLNHTCSHCSHG